MSLSMISYSSSRQMLVSWPSMPSAMITPSSQHSWVVKTSVKVTPNSPSQDYSHPDDHNLRSYSCSLDNEGRTRGGGGGGKWGKQYFQVTLFPVIASHPGGE